MATGAGLRTDIVRRLHRTLLLHRDVGAFSRGNDGKMADIGNKLPDLTVREIPGRHRRVPDAVADMIENLAIRQGRRQGAQNGRTREAAGAQFGFSAAVIGMAGLALGGEQVMPSPDVGRIRLRIQRIDLVLFRRRNAGMQQPGRHLHFKPRRLLSRYRQSGEQQEIGGTRQRQNHDGRHNEKASAQSHHPLRACSPITKS